MKRIAIIGAGIAGLVTAHGLLKAGYEVTLYSDRSPEAFMNETRPTGAAGRFEQSLAYERELGLNHWEGIAQGVGGAYVTLCLQPKVPFITLAGRVAAQGLAIDVRLQSCRWMHDLVERGGKLVIETVNMSRLDEIAAEHDLTIVAAGKGEISQLFPRNEKRSVYDKSQRNLAMVVLKNVGNYDTLPFIPVRFNLIAPYGEAFWVPFYHKTLGDTWCILFEAKPGTPMDKFMGAKSGEETLVIAKQVIKELFPWDYEWVKSAELADEHGWLVGPLTPGVRDPVGKLPSGRVVTGVGDTLMLLDPIGGQGANNGNRMAKHLVTSIIERGDGELDETWMRDTFEAFYRKSGEMTYTFNNLLLEPIDAIGQELFIAQYGSDGRIDNQSGSQKIANAFCENFNDPNSLTPIMMDMQKARQFIEAKTGSSWIRSAVRGRFAVVRDQVRQKLGGKPSVGYW